MPSKLLSKPPRFDRSPVARGLGQVPRRKSGQFAAGDGTDPTEKPTESPADTGEGMAEDDPPADGEGDPAIETELGAVDPTGGKYGAGIIRRMSVMTRGEALGHGFWVDATALQQTADAINAPGGLGIKSRFTHPSLSGDGFGKLLGRCFDAVVEGDRVLADLHFLESSHDTPDGDLAGYVMKLATEDPAAFGASIAFEHDEEGEQAFFDANQETVAGTDSRGNPKEISRFKSPDPENARGLWHMRLAELRAVDVVDEPAANPAGLFHRDTEILTEGESLLDFVLGLADKPPALSALSIDPERIKGFLARYSDRRGIALSVGKTSTDPRAEVKRYVEAFGAERGAAWFAEGIPWDRACEQQLAELRKENEQLKTRLAAVKLPGEAKPLGFSHPPKGGAPGGTTPPTPTGGKFNDTNVDKFASKIRIPTGKPSNN